jgi:hypothetical protein
MPSKKKLNNLDLTNLDTIKPIVSPEPSPETPPETSPETSPETPLEASPPAQPPLKSETLITPPTPPQENRPSPPSEDIPPIRRQFDRKPQRSEVKPLKTLSSATNEAGEVFNPGDKILAKAPWGKRALAEITTIYEDESGSAWAQYLPAEAVPENWSWLGGSTRASLLLKG